MIEFDKNTETKELENFNYLKLLQWLLLILRSETPYVQSSVLVVVFLWLTSFTVEGEEFHVGLYLLVYGKTDLYISAQHQDYRNMVLILRPFTRTPCTEDFSVLLTSLV